MNHDQHVPASAATLGDLRSEYGEQWQISELPGHAWEAFACDGASRWVIVSGNLDDLRTRLERAEA
jgi:hypothetical protein